MTHESPARDAAERIATEIVQDVCELPDRTSPDDWPEACLVTGEELHSIVLARLTTAPQGIPEGEAILAIIRDGTDEDGFLHNPFDVVWQIQDLFPTPPAQSSEYARGRAAGIEEAAQAAYVWWDGEPEDAEDLRIHLRALSAPTPVVEEWVK